MTEKRVQRRLAAILAADVVGYSHLMEQDEAGTLAVLKQRRTEILEPTVRAHGGRVVKLMGDGVLVEFASAVDAVQCAVELQKGFTEANRGVPAESQIVLRIGINLGDVIIEGSDIYGDGVNVAARLEGLAEPGGICISASVRDQVTGKLALTFDDLGERNLKNIAKPVHIYRAGTDGTHKRAAPPTLTLPDKPSIAVLPFQSMSVDLEQEYFCDGVVEDIITALSRIPWLFVIARNSSFTYKDKAVHLKQVGKELGVRYLVQGSIRRSGDLLRATAQLVDASTGSNLWTERYDRRLTDVFEVQDEITANIAGALGPSLRTAEIERAKQKRPDSLDTYDLYLRSLPSFYTMTRAGSDEAIALLRRALTLDPAYATAAASLAYCLVWRVPQGWAAMNEVGEEVLRYARLALELDNDNAEALAIAARVIVYLHRRYDEATDLARRAVESNPNSAFAHTQRGWVHLHAEQAGEGEDSLNRALRLSPRDTMNYDTWHGLAFAYLLTGRYEDAVTAARTATQQNAHHIPGWRTLAASLALAGLVHDGQAAANEVLRLDPLFRISTWRSRKTYIQGAQVYAVGMQLAGLPL